MEFALSVAKLYRIATKWKERDSRIRHPGTDTQRLNPALKLNGPTDILQPLIDLSAMNEDTMKKKYFESKPLIKLEKLRENKEL